MLPSYVLGWNAVGHRIIAQIAYDQMTDHAKQTFTRYNQALDKVYKPQSWVDSAVWLDSLSYQDISWFSAAHYIDIPYSTDGTPLIPPQQTNALWAIDSAKRLLVNKYATEFDKGVALRVLMHVVGDIHQPLHAVTRISVDLPQGDRGGNLVILPHNSIAKNLHAYWDRGGGLLLNKRRASLQLEKLTEKIEQDCVCGVDALDSNPQHWANESYLLAIHDVYQSLDGKWEPNNAYQMKTKEITEQRLGLAGCRLGLLLNQLDTQLPIKKYKHLPLVTYKTKHSANLRLLSSKSS